MTALIHKLSSLAVLAMGLALSACATAPGAGNLALSSPPARVAAQAASQEHKTTHAQAAPLRSISVGMPLPAPRAFLDFCRREPEECGAQPAEGRQPAQDANQMFWAAAFAQASDRPASRRGFATSTAAINTAQRPARLDWNERFDSARTARSESSRQLSTEIALRSGADFTPTVSQWAAVRKINARVNRAIVQRPDDARSPSTDLWSLPLHDGTGSGDCEDYVLEKRAALLEAGVPLEALSIAVVQTNWGETHAILLISTDKGEFVLDNLSPWVLEWEKVPYRWISRQQPGRTFQWMALTASASRG